MRKINPNEPPEATMASVVYRRKGRMARRFRGVMISAGHQVGGWLTTGSLSGNVKPGGSNMMQFSRVRALHDTDLHHLPVMPGNMHRDSMRRGEVMRWHSAS
jgi:hypothetical protein